MAASVDHITLHVPRGTLYGFLGPNGAGKTTTLRMIAGILRPTAGRVLLGGDDIHQVPLVAKRRLGYIPDRPFVYDKLTGAEFLRRPAGGGGGRQAWVKFLSAGRTVVRRTATGCGD
jgi:ABC-2 type transport system ATP-binding protein